MSPVRRIAVPGASLHADVVYDGTPVVVLPDGPGFGCDYLKAPLVPLLARRCQLWFVDLRGAGLSTVEDVSTLRLDVLAGDLEAVREAAGQDRLHLLAHGFGALVALGFAAAFPDRAASLCLVAPYPATGEEWARSRDVVAGRHTPDARAEMAAIETQDGWTEDDFLLARHFHLSKPAYFAGPEGSVAVCPTLNHPQECGNVRRARRALASTLATYDLRSGLARVACPTSIVAGSDGIFGPGAERRLAGLIPGATLIELPGASHYPHVEALESFRRHLVGFLEGLPAMPLVEPPPPTPVPAHPVTGSRRVRDALDDRYEGVYVFVQLALAVAAIPLTVLVAVLLFADLEGSARLAVVAATISLWALYPLDWLVRLATDTHPLRFARRNWADLLVAAVPIWYPIAFVAALRRPPIM